VSWRDTGPQLVRSGFAPPTCTGGLRSVGCTVFDVPVRAGEPSDAAFIVEMARLASVMEDRPLPPADDPALVRGLPLSPDTAVLALDHDGHPVGAAWWHFRDCPLVVTPDGAQVPELVVAATPSHRGRGVGRCLLDALAARAAEHGYDRLALNVHICNPAARLYSRAGFVVAGKGRGPLGVAMVLQLSAILH
jgi:GNAT superfamily N-acetyltransferase